MLRVGCGLGCNCPNPFLHAPRPTHGCSACAGFPTSHLLRRLGRHVDRTSVRAVGARLALLVFSAVPAPDTRLGPDRFHALCDLLGALVLNVHTGLDCDRLLSLHCPVPREQEAQGPNANAPVPALKDHQVGVRRVHTVRQHPATATLPPAPSAVPVAILCASSACGSRCVCVFRCAR